MARVRIELPDRLNFFTDIALRITDINYGGHAGNDSILSLIHEARVQFLQHHGYDEMDLAGLGLIMRDVAIEFKRELFYGDRVRIWVAAGEFSRIGFELYYRFTRPADVDTKAELVVARTTMICYNYKLKKIASLPPEVQRKISS